MLNYTCKYSTTIFSVDYSLKRAHHYADKTMLSTVLSRFCKSLRKVSFIQESNLFRYSSSIPHQQKYHFNEVPISSLMICSH